MDKQLAIPGLNKKNTFILLAFFLLSYMLITWIKSKFYFQPDREPCFLNELHNNSWHTEFPHIANLTNLIDIKIKKGSGFIHGWFLKHQGEHNQVGGNSSDQIPNSNQNRQLFIISHGNAGSIVNRTHLVHKLNQQFQADVIVYDYSGFGSTSTKYWVLTESVVQSDCLAVVNHFLALGYQKDNIILYGESIGVPITCHTALQTGILKLILQSGPASIKDVAQSWFTSKMMWIINLMVRNDFSTKNYLKKLKKIQPNTKAIVLHSPDDDIVFYDNAKILKEHGAEVIDIEGDHNNVVIRDSIWGKVKEYFRRD